MLRVQKCVLNVNNSIYVYLEMDNSTPLNASELFTQSGFVLSKPT